MAKQFSPSGESLEQLERRAAAEPPQYQHLVDLADAYAYNGRRREAIAAYEKAAALEDQDAILFNDLATMYEEEGNVQQAVLNYQRALAIEPQLATTHFNLALLLQERARYAEAVQHFEQCLEFSEEPFEIEESREELARLRPLVARQVETADLPERPGDQVTYGAWVSVARTAGSLEGEFIAGLLRSEQIPVQVWMEGAGQAFGLSVGSLGMGRVMVPESFLEEARALLAAEVDEAAIDEVEAAAWPERDDESDDWWTRLSKGMLGLAALIFSPVGVIITLLFSPTLDSPAAEREVTCPQCNVALVLDEGEWMQGWYVCPECGQQTAL